MAHYHFSCGEEVFLAGDLLSGRRADVVYTVVAHLPSEGTEPRYRIKAVHEGFSRVALQHMISPVPSPEPTGVVMDFPSRIKQISAANPILLPEWPRQSAFAGCQ